jgi:hypothetical protein
MAIDVRLARKGRGEPREGLIQQGKASVQIAKRHAAEIVAHGWPVEDTAQLEAGVSSLETEAAAQAEGQAGASGSTRAEREAIAEVKRFIRRLRNALPRALRDTKVQGVTAEAFHAGRDLGRSTPRLSDYLNRIRPSVVAIDEDLKRFFGGQLASAELDAAKAALDAADAKQESAIEGLPEATQKVYEAKGRVLEAIEDLNRAGRSAFDGDAEKAAQFNKDILLRARRERKRSTDPATPA